MSDSPTDNPPSDASPASAVEVPPATSATLPEQLPLASGDLRKLLRIRALLDSMGPGPARRPADSLAARVARLIAHLLPGIHPGQWHRLKLIEQRTRPISESLFAQAAAALLQRKRFHIRYHARSSDDSTEREISAQRLVCYRGNWYLDAYCHLRTELRTFALDRVAAITLLEKPCKEVGDSWLDAHFASAYGIMSGMADRMALLRFTAQRARWVADELWHPDQRGELRPDGSYELRLPYHNPDELVLDICRYGPDVEVLEPPSLRRQVAERLKLATALYE